MTATALLIGVPGPVTFVAQGRDYSFGPLAGVTNDIQWFQTFLHERLGPEAEMRTLTTPAETTVRALSKALTSAVAGCTDGSLLVIVFSGHGFQLPDESQDELDRLDEALVASDGPLLDDFFGRLWASNPRKFRVVEFIDSCSADSAGIALHYDTSPSPSSRRSGYGQRAFSSPQPWPTRMPRKSPRARAHVGSSRWRSRRPGHQETNRGSYLELVPCRIGDRAQQGARATPTDPLPRPQHSAPERAPVHHSCQLNGGVQAIHDRAQVDRTTDLGIR